MSKATATRPSPSEFAPFYAGYVSLVPDGDILGTLERQRAQTSALLASLPDEIGGYRYQPDKWSVRELVGHVVDSERIFSTRALRFARGDETPLPGFDQEPYVRNASFDSHALSELAAEFDVVRQATLFLFRHLDERAWSRRGVASNAEVTVRALAYIIAGHELHHRRILTERYL